MFETLKSVWSLAHEPKYTETGENLFVFQMFCRLRDWKRVVHDDPWLFKSLELLIEYYDGRNDLASVVVKGLYVWAQIHKIPYLYRHEEVVDQLVRIYLICMSTFEILSQHNVLRLIKSSQTLGGR